MATAAIGGLGRAVIPTTGGTLPVVAFLVGTVLILSALANLAISFLSTAFLGLIVVGLYRRSTGRGSMGRALDGQKRLAGPAVIRLPRRAWRWIGFAAVAAAAIYATVLSLNVPVGDSIEITAHRGSSGLAPENTMAAVEQAIVDGADWVEIDVQETADGIVVVHHDSDFRKIAGSRLRIWEATYEELRSLDIGSWFAPEFSGERLPTLEDVLLASKDRIRVNIELKHYGRARRLEEAVIEVVEKTGMESQIAIMSLKRESIQRARALRPEWTVGFLSAAAIGNLTRIDADFLAVNSGLATRSLIRAAHRRGQEVHVWTINDPAAMSALIGRGVDNLITDFPAVARPGGRALRPGPESRDDHD
jgi:glycerophosphoryl diester phosphodiesterase